MDKKMVEEITGRAISDPAFREGLMADPARVLRDAGYSVTEEVLGALKAAFAGDPVTLANAYEKRILGGEGQGFGGPMG